MIRYFLLLTVVIWAGCDRVGDVVGPVEKGERTLPSSHYWSEVHKRTPKEYNLVTEAKALRQARRQARRDARLSPGYDIEIDGEFTDWVGVETVSDPANDATGKFDVIDVASVLDNQILYVTFELEGGDSLTLQNGEKSDGTIQLIVADGSKQLTVDFRGRKFFSNEQALTWADVCFRCLPTYASNRYEVKLLLQDFDQDNIKIDFAGSDSLEEPASVSLVIHRKWWPPEFDIAKDPNVFRIANLNTLQNGLADKERGPKQHRLLAKVSADVYTFQEEWNEEKFDAAVPKLSDAVGAKLNTAWFGGCAIATRFQLIQLNMKLDRAVAGYVELSDGSRVVVISVYLRSSGYFGSLEDDLRIQQAQQIVGELKKLRDGEFGDDIKNTPVIVVGDYNLVGSKTPFQTLVDAGMTDLLCKNPSNGEANTWRGNSNSSFWPGRLDLLCHDEKLTPVNGWVLDSRTLGRSELDGIQAEDSEASDHLILIGDFTLGEGETPEIAGVSDAATVRSEVTDMKNAIYQFDAEAALKYMHPKIVATMGDDETAKAVMEATCAKLKAAGMKLETLSVGDPVFLETEEIAFAIVPTEIVLEVKGARFEVLNYHLGIRENGKAEWKYIDGSHLNQQLVQEFFPDFPSDYELPESQMKRLN